MLLVLWLVLFAAATGGRLGTSSVYAQTTNLPVITSMNPNSGPIGTRVVILGSNLVDVVAVRFGDIEAAFGYLAIAGNLYADVPTNAVTGPITVVTSAGQTTSSDVFTVTVVPPPVITAIQPTEGEPGTGVTISGSNFVSVIAVRFNGKDAVFTVLGTSTILATVPADASSGLITVLTSQGTAASPTVFTVLASQLLSIQSFSPSSGPVGTPVTIQGPTVGQAHTVQFNGVAAAFISLGADRLSASVPEGATTGPITIITAAGTATSTESFAVTQLPGPVIQEFSPLKGNVGTPVLLLGTSFNRASAVKFNGVAATFTILSQEVILTGVPAGATTGPITVESPLGTNTSSLSFIVLSADQPQITSFIPMSGPPGTQVAITGNNLINVQSVAFNGTIALFETNNGLKAIVPETATTGPIAVTTMNGTASSTAVFTVTRDAEIQVLATIEPAVLSVQDQTQLVISVTNAGPFVATGVTVSSSFAPGENLSPTNWPADSLLDLALTNIQPQIGACVFENKLLTWQLGILPPNLSAILTATMGPLPAGTLNCLATVTAIEPDPIPTNNVSLCSALVLPPQPTISGFEPTQGLPGTSVLILGSNLIDVQAVTLGAISASFATNDGLRITVPEGAVSGPIAVTTANGTATSTEPFVILSQADLQISIIESSDTNQAPTNAQFDLTLQNAGPQASQNPLVTVRFARGTSLSATNWPSDPPSNLVFHVIIPSVGTTNIEQGILTWEPGLMEPGSTASLHLELESLSVGQWHALAEVSAQEHDPDVTNNSELASVQILPQITELNPASGSPGIEVRIIGTGLDEVTGVFFGGAPAVFSTEGGLKATVPTNAITGAVTVETPAGTATGPLPFVVVVTSPILEVRQLTSSTIEIGWTSSDPAWILQTTTQLSGANVSWADSVTVPEVTGESHRIELDTTEGRSFFRLIRR